mmetsp:Transcript_60593/g.84271  ORF Transcript_60593/g.84271 Transcript_60593/m.84271 type:complete len:231 (-) Transcript_60593:35-727(-)
MTSSIMAEPLVDRIEPLVDQALRIRSKVNGSIYRRTRRKRKTSRRSGSGDDGSVISGISSACSESIDILSASYGGGSGGPDDCASVVSQSQHSYSIEPVEEDIINKLTVDVPVQHFGDYRTITMNEFFKECLITDCEGSAVVHFFDENDPASIELDQTLKRLGEKYTACKFLRIDGSGASFVCKKLSIDTFPTVLAIRNKIVLDRLVDFTGTDSEFEKWVLDSIPLINGH